MIDIGVRYRGKLNLAIIGLLLLSLISGISFALSNTSADQVWLNHPYDPKPLLQQAAAQSSDNFTFAVFGDSYAVPVLNDLLKLVDSRHPTFVITTGDMVATGGGENGLDDWQKLSDRAGWFFRTYATWPVNGNHELTGDYNSGLANYLAFYNLQDQNFSFTFGNSKFIVLGVDAAERPSPSDQVQFLRKELADRDKYTHVFVCRHYPFYTVGSKSKKQVPNKQTELTKLLKDKRVTTVFAGHDHIYYRTRRDGVMHITAGFAGAPMYQLKRVSERVSGDAYMGKTSADTVILHRPGQQDKRLPGSTDRDLFAVFIHVMGKKVTGKTVTVSEVELDKFVIK